MGELKLTPARLKLLQAIADGAVTQRGSDIYVDCIGAGWEYVRFRFVKVTARVLELRRAGWAEQSFSSREWELTNAGRAALESVP